jgi:hypothetical protein
VLSSVEQSERHDALRPKSSKRRHSSPDLSTPEETAPPRKRVRTDVFSSGDATSSNKKQKRASGIELPSPPASRPKSRNYKQRRDPSPLADINPSDSESPAIVEPESPLFGGSDDESAAEEETSTRLDADTPLQLTMSSASHSLPPHRARTANPLVKMVDNHHFNGMNGAISVKARVSRDTASATSNPSIGSSQKQNGKGESLPTNTNAALVISGPSSARPQPQKRTSSLLTFHKGSLKTVKGKYLSAAVEPQQPVAQEVNTGELFQGDADDGPVHGSMWATEGNPASDVVPGLIGCEHPTLIPESVPTGQELLEMAGFDPQVAEELEDFEENPPPETNNDQAVEPERERGSLLQQK